MSLKSHPLSLCVCVFVRVWERDYAQSYSSQTVSLNKKRDYAYNLLTYQKKLWNWVLQLCGTLFPLVSLVCADGSLYDSICRYFEDEEEDSNNVDLPYIPAENSPTRQQFHSKPPDSDSEDDPLEAFMAEVEVSYHFFWAAVTEWCHESLEIVPEEYSLKIISFEEISPKYFYPI